ncbi:MAG: DinB family protein [Bacteroidia bacterium]|nr:DinB family protein [Bacteroidia bacterium]
MTTPALLQSLSAGHQAFADQIGSLGEAEFMAAAPGKWTPGQQLDHIRRSVGPVLLAFRLPRFVLRRLFGTANRPSRSYEELVQRYQDRLAKGGRAPGPFIPAAVPFAQRAALSARLMRSVEQLCRIAGRMPDAELDRCILPHPLLGKLTLREMLYFTRYHVQHHQAQLPAAQ